MELDLSNEHTNTIMEQYGELLCSDCREALLRYGAAITDRLNEGKKPRMRDVLRLQRALCPVCYGAVLRKKVGGMS